MSARVYIYCMVLAIGLGVSPRVLSQTTMPIGIEQMVLCGTDEGFGTSRFTGMAGAMTAVGGDPSAVKINPAGLGIYRHSQFSVSADVNVNRYWQDGYDRGNLYTRWHLPQASYVFAVTHPERLQGIVSNNVMVSFSRRQDLTRIVTVNDRVARPANTDWTELYVDESGYRNDVDVHYAMNISNCVYWGIGMSLEWMNIRQTTERWAIQMQDRHGNTTTSDMKETTTGRGVTWGASLGVLIRPVQMVRIGLAVESPMVGRMRETYYYTEILNGVTNESPDYNSSWQLVAPVKATAGLALQLKRHGLLSVQYDMRYHKLTGFAHTLRAGAELVVGRHVMFDLGYSYSTAFERQQAGGGVQYMGHWLRIGFAYQYAWVNMWATDVQANRYIGSFRTGENRFVVTFQWNS